MEYLFWASKPYIAYSRDIYQIVKFCIVNGILYNLVYGRVFDILYIVTIII